MEKFWNIIMKCAFNLFKKIKNITVVIMVAAVIIFPLARPTEAPAASNQPAQIPAKLEESKNSLNLQTNLPGSNYKEVQGTNRRVPPRPRPQRKPMAIPEWLAKLILYSMGITLAVILIWNIVKHLKRSDLEAEDGDYQGEPVDISAMAERLDSASMEAEEFARRGDFIQAMHVLLLQSVSEMKRLLNVPIAESLTSREIYYKISLTEEARSAFADIVGKVEISYFGDHNPGETDYLACRRSFESLTGAIRERRD